MKKTFVADVSSKFSGTAEVYHLDPPVRYFDNDDKLRESEHVVVSAISNTYGGGPGETYIFPSDADGLVTHWGELPGSSRGQVSISEAIEGLRDEPIPDNLDDSDEAWSWVDEEELNS